MLQSSQQQHLDSIKADGTELEGMGNSLLDLMLMEVLHQTQHLNELAASGIAHP